MRRKRRRRRRKRLRGFWPSSRKLGKRRQRPREKVRPKYLRNLLNLGLFQRLLRAKASGSQTTPTSLRVR